MTAAPGDEVNPVAAGWMGPIVGWVFLFSKYCEDEGGIAAANAGAGNGLYLDISNGSLSLLTH
jgi:hypothetical protein